MGAILMEEKNRWVFIEWWAWVDLNHQSRPYQGSGCPILIPSPWFVPVGIFLELQSESGR